MYIHVRNTQQYNLVVVFFLFDFVTIYDEVDWWPFHFIEWKNIYHMVSDAEIKQFFGNFCRKSANNHWWFCLSMCCMYVITEWWIFYALLCLYRSYEETVYFLKYKNVCFWTKMIKNWENVLKGRLNEYGVWRWGVHMMSVCFCWFN